MSKIIKQDSNGVKPLLAVGEFGYDNYPEGGDIGRVYVGNGSENIPQAKKAEVVAVDGKVNKHVARNDNPHSVTKTQVGLDNVDNTADSAKSVLSATKLTTARTINGVAFDGSANIIVSDSTAVKLTGNQTIAGTKTFSSNIVGNVTGNAGTATTLATARNITLSGDASGTASFNGSADASIVVVVADNSHAHTIANVTGLQSTLDAKVDDSEKGAANGVATLDVNGKVVLTQIPDSVLGQLEYQGVWDFTTLPTSTQKGQYWIASVSGNGYEVGDWAVWNGVSFDKVDNTDAVATVAGRTGNVVLTKSDVGLSNVNNTADVDKPISNATQTALNNKLDSTTYTTSDILAKLKTVDGAGSGLDADLLDGKHANEFMQTGYCQADLNTMATAGSYSVQTGHLNMPSGVDNGNMLVLRTLTADGFAQIITDYQSNNIYWRSGSAVGWKSWRRILSDGNALTTSPLGYANGAGGSVTQATSKSTSVTLNKLTGQIVMHNASLGSGTPISFILYNSMLGRYDTMQINLRGDFANNYRIKNTVNTGASTITITNESGATLSEPIVLNFNILKGADS